MISENEEHKSEDNQEERKQEDSNKLVAFFPPLTAAFFGLVAVFLLYQIGGSILTLLIFGMDFEKADINAVRLLTMGGQIMLILLPALLLAKFVYSDVTTVLRVKLPKLNEILLFLIGLAILTPLLQNLVYLQNFLFVKLAESNAFVGKLKDVLDQLDKMVETTYGGLLKSHSLFETSFIIFVAAVVPALCEETFFRGFVQKSFEQKFKPIYSAIITSVFFGLYHFNPYGLVALIALGLYFGFAAYTTGSIFVPMILHFTNNLIAILAYLILGSDELIASKTLGTDEIMSNVISLIILLIIFSIFIYLLKRNYKTNSQNKNGGNHDMSEL